MTRATIEMLMPDKDGIHTMTVDNVKEFKGHQKIAQALEAELYFAHPYANENANGLLRQYVRMKILSLLNRGSITVLKNV